MDRPEYPRSAKYDKQWQLESQMGPNALWLTEWLCEKMDLRPGMRVLDMGCGKGLSSVFLAREFDVQVFANDLWIPATENLERFREHGVDDQVFPMHAEARSLPYAEGFFDAIVSVDSYQYYGTDDLYLIGFRKLVKVGGEIGIVYPALVKDFEDGVPEHINAKPGFGGGFWADDCWCFHTPEWWHHLWQRTGLVDVHTSDHLPEAWKMWRDWEVATEMAGTNIFPSEAHVLEADAGRYLSLGRTIARRLR
ncbi:MAG: methyltransferase domain-containing protein [Armatimonadia bacterium]|nr:methyltransferase domain-containing protein [Armatimonadia bacterium]